MKRSRTMATCWRSSKVLIDATTDSNSLQAWRDARRWALVGSSAATSADSATGPQAPPQRKSQGQRHHRQQPQTGLDELPAMSSQLVPLAQLQHHHDLAGAPGIPLKSCARPPCRGPA